MFCPDYVVEYCEKDYGARHQDRKVHMCGCDGRGNRPEAEEKDDDPEHNGECIHNDAKYPWQVEGTPHELVHFSSVAICDLRCGADGSSNATPQQEALGDDVGGVERANAERYHVVESGG